MTTITFTIPADIPTPNVSISFSPPVPPPSPEQDVPTRFSNRRVLRKCLLGTVELVHDTTVQCDRVIKTSRTNKPNPKIMDDVYREIDILTYVTKCQRKTKSKFVAELLEVLPSDENKVHLLLEDGGSELFSLVDHEMQRRLPGHKGPLTAIPQILSHWKQLVDIVYFLHVECEVAHLDISLENFVFNENSEMRIIDFGVARKLDPKEKRHFNLSTQKDVFDGAPIGKLQYMSARNMLRYPYNGFQQDVYSLSVCFWMLLTGFFPYNLDKANGSHQLFVQGDIEPLLCAYGMHEILLALPEGAIHLLERMSVSSSSRADIREVKEMMDKL